MTKKQVKFDLSPFVEGAAGLAFSVAANLYGRGRLDVLQRLGEGGELTIRVNRLVSAHLAGLVNGSVILSEESFLALVDEVIAEAERKVARG